jgi:uncharacterized protein
VRGLVVQMLLMVGAVLLAAHALNPGLRRSESANENMMLAYGAMLLLLLIRGRVARVEWKRLMGPGPTRRDLPLLGIVVPLGLITAAALVLLFVPLSYLAPDVVERTILDESPFERITSTRQFVLLFINIAVIAPIVEELAFRGFFLQRFAHKWGTTAGVIASSTLFAIGHVEWIGHFVTGVAFAVIYLRTRSLWMSMLAHGVYNAMFATSMGWSYFTGQPYERTTLAEFQQGLGEGLLAFGAGMFLLWLYLDLYWKERTVTEVMQDEVPYASNGERRS